MGLCPDAEFLGTCDALLLELKQLLGETCEGLAAGILTRPAECSTTALARAFRRITRAEHDPRGLRPRTNTLP